MGDQVEQTGVCQYRSVSVHVTWVRILEMEKTFQLSLKTEEPKQKVSKVKREPWPMVLRRSN